MNVTTENYGHAVILICKGDLTEDSLDALQRAVEHALQDDQVIDVVLNLAQVPFVDSMTLEYLLDLRDRLADRLGQVRLVGCDENVRKILEITRLAGTFEVFEDVSQAVQAVGA